jgi:hypothetical protein
MTKGKKPRPGSFDATCAGTSDGQDRKVAAGLFAAVAAFAAGAALAQAPAQGAGVPAPRDSIMVNKSCDDCGVVRSIRKVETKQPLDSADRSATAGLVASIPLDGSRAQIGSSTDLRKEMKPPGVTWEIVVRLDDGRFRVVLQDDPGTLREDDKVKIVEGKVQLRSN